ncbi:MAG: hypothetical protein SGCHY_000557 [Lobulomycetales sp.]
MGGDPIWLSHAAKPIVCADESCSARMILLLQISTNEDSPPQAVNRMIYVFICPNGGHSAHVVRSQTAQLTAVPENVCAVCNFSAEMACESSNAYYCCEKHLSLHKEAIEPECGRRGLEKPFRNPLAFNELEICSEPEPLAVISDMNSLNVSDGKHDGSIPDYGDFDAPETDCGVDHTFLEFQRRVEREPEQILRYYRNDDADQQVPLYACPIDETFNIPKCELCGGERSLEFQIMPQILNELDNNVDFGTLIIYSCDSNCHIADDGFAKEVVVTQNFTKDSMKFEL